ncbi:hypothetical protein ACUH9Y_04440 [Dermabacteraceae bacterium P13115]|nr:ferric reductase-like transmembrane domain-containing protein [Dermabacteraceae bacterium TAE3-ERU5]
MLTVLKFLYEENQIIFGFAALVPLLFLLRKNIRKHAVWYYLGATILCFLSIGMEIHWGLTDTYPTETWWWPINSQIRRGSFGFVLFTVVMFQGVIKPWNTVTKQLYAIRGEISILACIFSFAHLMVYGLGYFYGGDDEFELPYEILFYTSLALLLIGIPLFITSFKKIRFSMKAAAWQKLHKWSYAFYFILFANVILVFVRRILVFGEYLEKEPAYLVDTYLSLVLYTGIFVVYTVLRIKTDRNRREKEKLREERRRAHERGMSLHADS